MNILKRVPKENVTFLMELNYNNLFLHLKLLNGKCNISFAGIQIMQHEVLWQIDNNEEYSSLIEADKDTYDYVQLELQSYIQKAHQLIESNSLLKPYAKLIVTYPSDEYIFFKFEDRGCFIVITGWGCERKKDCQQEKQKVFSPETITDITDIDIKNEEILNIVDPLSVSKEPETTVDESIRVTKNHFVPQMTFGNAIKTCYRKYATFRGRATRKEYWYFYLYNALVTWVLSGLAIALSSDSQISGFILILEFIFVLISLLPSISVGVRRLHDTGRSGWDLMISFIPLVGVFIVLYFLCCASDKNINMYGAIERQEEKRNA